MEPCPEDTTRPSIDPDELMEECKRSAEETLDLLDKLPVQDPVTEGGAYASLNTTLQRLAAAIAARNPEAVPTSDTSEAGSGLLGRLKRGLFGGKKKEEQEGGEKAEAEEETAGLRGDARAIPLPELIGFLAAGRKTGVIWVHSVEETFLIELKQGHLIHATSDRTPDGLRLGEILVKQDALTERQLATFLITKHTSSGMLGVELCEEGLISSGELRSALAYQVQQIFHRLLEAKDAEFRFEEGMQLMIAQHVNLNITQLLLESARVHDEREFSLEMLESQMQHDLPTADDIDLLPTLCTSPSDSAEAEEKQEGAVEEGRANP